MSPWVNFDEVEEAMKPESVERGLLEGKGAARGKVRSSSLTFLTPTQTKGQRESRAQLGHRRGREGFHP